MKIIYHIVKYDEKVKFIEPEGWPIWLLQDDDGKKIETSGGLYLSCSSRKLAETIRYELLTSELREIKELTCQLQGL